MTGYIQDRGSGKKATIRIFKKCRFIFVIVYKQFSIYNVNLIVISLATLKIDSLS
jgi:hypothetical protein